MWTGQAAPRVSLCACLTSTLLDNKSVPSGQCVAVGVDVLRLGIMAADIVACVGVVSVSDAPQPWPRGYYRQRSRPGWCGGAW